MSSPQYLKAGAVLLALTLLNVSGCRSDAEAHPHQGAPIPVSESPVLPLPQPDPLMWPNPLENGDPEVKEPSDEVVQPPALQTSVYDWMAMEAARDELHALLDASKPDTWTCRKKQTEIPEYDELDTKQKRRVDWWWRGSVEVRDRFGYDIKYWRKMMPLYTQKGVCHLRNFVRDGLTEISFLGAQVRVNAAVAPLLKRAERKMMDKGIHTAPFDLVGGFHPRTTRGPFGEGKHLSRHGLGIAVDFDWPLNPYFSRREVMFIEKLTEMKFERSATIPAGKRWDNIKLLHDTWLERIGPWLEATQAEMAELGKTRRGKLGRRYKRLRMDYSFVMNNRNLSRAIDHGFLSLPRDFVIEMENVGLVWATDFKGGPDLMHFEYRQYTGNPRYHPHPKRRTWKKKAWQKPKR